MLERLREGLTWLLLWLRGVGIGDRVLPKGQQGGRSGSAEGELGGPAKKDLGELREGASLVGRVGKRDEVDPIALHARESRGTTTLDGLPFDADEGSDARPAPTRREWMAALLEEHGVGSGGGTGLAEEAGESYGPGTIALPGGGTAIAGQNERGPLGRGQRLELVERAGKLDPEVLASWRAFPKHLVPPGDPAHRELVHAAFDTGKLHLLQRLNAEDLFPYACRMWQPGKREANLELAHVLHERLAKLMGSIFDFDPAPLATGNAMPRRMHACYDETSGQLFLSGMHLVGTLPSLMEAMTHQQAHCLQHQLIQRLDQVPGFRDGDPREAIAQAWGEDFKRWRHTCQPLTIGYHAMDLGGAVGRLMREMEADERIQPSGPSPRCPG